MTEPFSGFFPVNKPPGISTFDVIRIIKKRTGIKKIGHSGTLDPFAEGLVVIMVGQMTKLFDYFSLLPKTYRAFAEFGKSTDTLDNTGTVTGEYPVPDIDTIRGNISYFTGMIKQKPPAYSAVHINGIRSYELARKGIIPETREKDIQIFSISINSFKDNNLDFNVTCSSGTYIRTLANDLANRCGSSAFLTKLVRTSIGSFNLENSLFPDEITTENLMSQENGFNLLGIPVITADNLTASRILVGKNLKEGNENTFPLSVISFFTESGRFLSLVDNRKADMKYIFVASKE